MQQQTVGSMVINLEARTAQIQADMAQAKRVVGDALGSIQQDSRRAADAIEGMASESGAAAAMLDGLRSAVGAVGVGSLVSSLAAAEKQFGGMNVQLTVATGSSDLAAAQFAKLEAFANRMALPIEGVTQSFTKLKNLGLDPSERALASYANTSAASNKSIMDMIEAVADATTGEFERLKEFGIKSSVEGDRVKLTFQGVETEIENSSSAIAAYLISIGEVQYAGAQELQARTLTGALNLLQNKLGEYQRQVNASGVGQAMIDGTQLLANHLDELGAGAGVVAAVLGGRLAGSLASSAAATVAAAVEKRGAAVAAAQLAQSELVLATRHKELALLELSRARSLGVTTAASEAAAIATANYNRALSAAQAAQVAASSTASVLQGALGLLGGPIGLVTTALTVGAMAWAAWGNSGANAVDDLNEKLREHNRLKKNLGSSDLAGWNDTYRQANEQLKSLLATQQRLQARGEHTGGIDAEIDRTRKTMVAAKQHIAEMTDGLQKQAAAAKGVTTETAKTVEFLTRAQQKQKEIDKVSTDFNKATVGRKLSPGQLADFVQARNEKLAEIEKRYADKPDRSAAAAVRAAEQTADAYGDLDRSLQQIIESEQELTTVRRISLQLEDKRYKGLSDTQRQALLAKAARADEAKAAKKLAEEDAKRVDAQLDAAVARESEILALRSQAEQYGLTTAEIADATARTWELSLAEAEKNGATVESLDYLRQQAARYRELATAQAGLQDRRDAGDREKLAADEARRAAEEWQKSADQINQALTDALMKGFEDGKGFADSFADSVKATFKTMVLRPLVQAVVQPVGDAVNAALYGGQGGQGGVGGMFSAGGFGVGSAAGLGSLVGSFGNLTGSATTSAYGTGMGLGAADAEAAASAFRTSGMNDIADSLLAGQKMASMVGKVANVAGYAMAAYNGIKAIEQGRWGAAAGTAIGAFTPLGPLGAAIGGQLGGLLDGAFGGGGGQKFGGEGAIGRSTAGLFPEGQTDAQVQSALEAFGTGLKEVAQRFGAQLGDVQFAFGYETDPQGDAGNFFSSKLAVDGVTVRDINVVKFDGDAEAKMAAEFKLATVLALKQANLAPELQQAFEGFDPATAVAADVDKVMARLEQLAGVQKAFEGLSLAMPQLSKLTLAAKEHILSLAGGVDALTGAAQTYYQGFYSEAERVALTSKQVAEALGKVGVAMPATRDEYRKQVEALDLSSDAGRKAYAAMLGLAGAFGTVADAGKSAAEEMAQVAQQRLADAESVLRTAYDRESAALKSTADRLQAFTRSLRDFRQSLTLGELSTLSPEAKYGAARDEFDKVLAAAAAGDEEAQDKLTEVAQAYLEASRAYNASSAQYVEDYNRVQSALLMLEATGKASETVARQQLTLMQKQVGALLKLDDSVISVRDAVARLYMLRAESGTVEPIAPIDTTQPGTVGGSLVTNLNALYQQVLGRDVDMSGLHYYSGQLGAGKTLDWVYRDILASDEAKRRILDGSHAGGLASVPFDGYVAELHAGERVLTAQQSREYAAIDWSRFGRGGSDALVAEVKALRAEVAALRADNAADAAAGRRQTEVVARATLAQGGQLVVALDRAAADRI